jgi:hypothetical protein
MNLPTVFVYDFPCQVGLKLEEIKAAFEQIQEMAIED